MSTNNDVYFKAFKLFVRIMLNVAILSYGDNLKSVEYFKVIFICDIFDWLIFLLKKLYTP